LKKSILACRPLQRDASIFKERDYCIFSLPLLKYAYMITREEKTQAIADLQVHETDTGSPQAQASILTKRIRQITEHLKQNKHDFKARRGLLQMVGRRRKLLAYLERTNFDAYRATVAKLGLRK